MTTQERKTNAKNSTAKNSGMKFLLFLKNPPTTESMKAYFSKVKKTEFVYKDAQETFN